MLPALERRHEVLAPTLPGHAGGPPLPGEVTIETILDALERALDKAGFTTAHIAGNSFGGYLALRLAARGRARSVVALAPAGGWAAEDKSVEATLEHFVTMQEVCRRAAPFADSIVSTPEGRRRATLFTTTNFEHIPPELLAHQLCGVAVWTRSSHCSPWPAGTAGASTRSASRAPCASSGGPRTGCSRGRPARPAFGMTGCRTPTGSCSTGSVTAPSWTYRSRPRN